MSWTADGTARNGFRASACRGRTGCESGCDSSQVNRLPQSSNVLPNWSEPLIGSKPPRHGSKRKSTRSTETPGAWGSSAGRIVPPLPAAAP